MRKLYAQSAAVRVGRVACVFGIAGVGNSLLRAALRDMNEGAGIHQLPSFPEIQVPVTALVK